ncbi:MAG: oligosaccharide flippase family protein [Acidobacteria bacterium]|nr:oligosaccharide flippase family protein [Acidobacteriota bacterium]
MSERPFDNLGMEAPMGGGFRPQPQRELFKRYGVLVSLSAGARVFGFVAVVLMARGLGVEVFGELTFAQAIVGYGVTFMAFGLGIYGIRAAVRQPAELGTLASSIIGIRLVLGALAYSILIAVSLLPTFRPMAGLIALFGLTLFTSAIYVDWVALAQQRTDVIGISGLATQLLFLGQVFVALRLGLGKHAVPVALVTSELVVGLGLLLWLHRRVGSLRPPLDLAGCRGIVRRAAPIAGSQMLRAVALSSDLVLLGLLVTMDQVGAYGAAYKIFIMGFTFVSLYVSVVLPHLVHHGTASVEQLSTEVGSLLWKALALAVPAALLGIALAPRLMGAVFGSEFATASTPMRLLILAVVASLIAAHYRPAVLALGEHKIDLRNVASASLVHVSSKLLLIPLLGLTGAALGTLLGEAVFAGTSWLTIRRLVTDAQRGKATLGSSDGGDADPE